MATQAEKDKAWRRVQAVQSDAADEERTCRKRGRHTMHCMALVRDARTLKNEYEKLCRQPTSNPLSIAHGERFMKEKIVGDLMGRNGIDTHHGLDGDKSRRPGT